MNLYIEVKTIEQWQTACEWMNGCRFDIGLNLVVDINIAERISRGLTSEKIVPGQRPEKTVPCQPSGKADIDQSSEESRISGRTNSCRLWLSLPEVARENDACALKLTDVMNREIFSGVVVKNFDEIGLLKNTGYAGGIIGDSFLYAYNKKALDMYEQLFPGMKFMAADELTDRELEALTEEGKERFIYKIYGCQRLMVTAQDTGTAFFENGKGDQFIAGYDPVWKYSVVYNKKPTFMMDGKGARKWPNLLVAFTVEGQNETGQILHMLDGFLSGEDVSIPQGFEYAKGHHMRGIE